MNKIEAIKSEKDGLDILRDIPAFARHGWQAISPPDRDRLKWAGIFFRRQTPGRFMMRVRITNGISNSDQFRALAGISHDYGAGFADLTTRQQVQLRDFTIAQAPDIWARLDAVGLISLQTGMDNIRTVVGCPAAGLTPANSWTPPPSPPNSPLCSSATAPTPTCPANSMSASPAAWKTASMPIPRTSPSRPPSRKSTASLRPAST